MSAVSSYVRTEVSSLTEPQKLQGKAPLNSNENNAIVNKRITLSNEDDLVAREIVLSTLIGAVGGQALGMFNVQTFLRFFSLVAFCKAR